MTVVWPSLTTRLHEPIMGAQSSGAPFEQRAGHGRWSVKGARDSTRGKRGVAVRQAQATITTLQTQGSRNRASLCLEVRSFFRVVSSQEHSRALTWKMRRRTRGPGGTCSAFQLLPQDHVLRTHTEQGIVVRHVGDVHHSRC